MTGKGPAMVKRYYEDFAVGDRAESAIARTVTEGEVYTQAGLEGNYSPLHTDREYMQGTEYGRRIVQNTLLLTISNGLNHHLPWDCETIAAYGRDNVRFVNPVFIGDTVRLESEVVAKRAHDAGGIVSFREDLLTQSDELAVTGEYLLLVERAP